VKIYDVKDVVANDITVENWKDCENGQIIKNCAFSVLGAWL